MLNQNIKSVTSRQEIKPIKANITREQYQTLTKLYTFGKVKTVESDLNLQQQQISIQQQQQTITPKNNTPQSCRTAQEVLIYSKQKKMRYFLYQKNNLKEQGKISNNSQVLPKTKNSLHRNFSQLEKSANALLTPIIQTTTTPQSKQKKYNLMSIDSKLPSNQFAQQIAQQLKKKNDTNKKENLKFSLDDFITQVSRTNTKLISPFKQTKSLSPSTRVESAKPRKQIYYISSLVEAFKHSFPQTSQQQLFRDHAIQTFNCIGFCINLQESDQQIIQSKLLNLPPKLNCKYQKTVVFDLDETLIHCNENQTLKADVYLPITFPSGDTVQAGINIRPYAKWILQELSQICEVIVFTASHQCYASQVIQYLDPKNQLLSAQLFRDNCVLSPDGVHIKDLKIFNRDLKDIVLVDNAAYSFGVHIENGIPIIPYYDNKDDKELKNLYDFLIEQVLPAPDCRLVLQSTFRLREYLKYNEPKLAIEKLF
ncbi:unnamed protein product [Paramecium primaurelia]|uniref:FCP1 homology domain-containing protein n=1 Tax=Paramecium primaurelia TaxID=5886 RepID=A0A8S1KGW2_PARPR|nr:unnamed protein product [Paramecium primaurelia]